MFVRLVLGALSLASLQVFALGAPADADADADDEYHLASPPPPSRGFTPPDATNVWDSQSNAVEYHRGQMLDVNDDGLLDFFEAFQDATSANDEGGQQKVWLNTGCGWKSPDSSGHVKPCDQYLQKREHTLRLKARVDEQERVAVQLKAKQNERKVFQDIIRVIDSAEGQGLTQTESRHLRHLAASMDIALLNLFELYESDLNLLVRRFSDHVVNMTL